MLSDLIALKPPPYGKEVHRASAIMMRGIVSDEIELELAQNCGGRAAGSVWASTHRSASEASSSRPSTPSGPLRAPSHTSSVGSERSSVGRPANPTCEVIVYAYAPGPTKPMVIRAVGTPRDNVVEFTFGQPKVYDALGIDAASRRKPAYKIWSQAIEDWSSYPKAHHPLFLAPGERVLYREEYVHHLPDLEYIKSQLTSQDRSLAGRPVGLPLPAGIVSTSPLSLQAGPAFRSSPPLLMSRTMDREHSACSSDATVSAMAGKGKKRAHQPDSEPSTKRTKSSLSSGRTRPVQPPRSVIEISDSDSEGTSRKMIGSTKHTLKGEAVMEAIVISDSDLLYNGGPVQGPPQNEADVQTRKQKLQEKWGNVKDTLRGCVPDEHKDRVNDQTQRVKNFLSDEYFPEERRDQFIFRLKKVVYECQSHQDYQGSMQWLLNFLEEYASHGRTIAEHGKDSHQQLTSDPNLQTSMHALLERFANGRSLDTIGDAMRALYDAAQQDKRLRHWFRDVDEFVHEALLQPGYILDDQANERAKELRENGRRFYDKYKGHFNNLINSVQAWFGAIAEDPLNKQFGNNFAQLAKDLSFDCDSNLKFKPKLWADVRQQILPGFIDQVGYVPIPRIEYTDESIDLVIENLALSGKNLFPNLISMEARNFAAKLSAYKTIKDEFHHEFTLTLGQVQADMRDVAFYFRKKTGTPKITDSGLADVLLGSSGLTVTVHLVSADKDRSSVFKVKDVNTSIHTLKFSIRDSKHDMLYKMLSPLGTGLVKKQLQKAIGQAMRTTLEYVDGQLVSVRDQMAQAKASEDASRPDVLKQQLQARKQEADKAHQKEERITQPEDELLPGAGHPAGWVNRTQERVQAASTGEEWRNEAYNIAYSGRHKALVVF
ncbi:hypothetical protein GY45DRAFT_1375112 [Cubamyces sp. BRFM 1775]|nr:hypothetical protein GY45DRAFT_1375112 [Cubamyces sp. BRFM 1775]